VLVLKVMNRPTGGPLGEVGEFLLVLACVTAFAIGLFADETLRAPSRRLTDPPLTPTDPRRHHERTAFRTAARTPPVPAGRRRFGYTAAVMGLAGGYLFDSRALAQTAADEEKKQKAAKVTMLFATEYKIEDYVKYPIMQAKYKDNIETQSKGQIYTKLHPAGQLGIGAALAQKIQAGTVHGGAVSLSNFSPYTPVVDLINIPYWCGDNQRFANLVTSKAWNDEITPKVMAKGYKPLFYFTVDPRTIASRKGFKVIKTPSDMQGMKMRVPPSKLLQTFYRLAGANPTVVPWGETATAIKQGVADGWTRPSPRWPPSASTTCWATSATSARCPMRRCSPPTPRGTSSCPPTCARPSTPPTSRPRSRPSPRSRRRAPSRCAS
jgi:hypothetical protein